MPEVSTEEKREGGVNGRTDVTVTHESFTGFTYPPSDAFDVVLTLVDGKYTSKWTTKSTGLVIEHPPTTFTIQGGMEQQPLATHPMFQASGRFSVTDEEWKKWKKFEADNTDITLAGWKPDGTTASDGMKKFYAYFNRGVVDFLLGTCTVRVESINGDVSLGGLGHIDSPPRAPGLGDRRTWMLVGVDATPVDPQQPNGNLRVTHEYRASAAGGWDEEIYS